MRFLWTVAWRNLWRHKRRTLITSTAMAIGVAICMLAICFQDGMYLKMFEVMVEQELGHVVIQHPKYPHSQVMYDTVKHSDELLHTLDADELLLGAAPRMEGFALLGTETKSAGAALLGIVPSREYAVTRFDQRVVQGEPLSGEPGEIVLGVGLAKEIKVSVGSEVVAVSQAADGSMGNALYTVVGLARTGSGMMDRNGAWMNLSDLQELMVLEDQVHKILLLTKQPDELKEWTSHLRQIIGDNAVGLIADGEPIPEDEEAVQVLAWQEASPKTVEMLGLSQAGSLIMLFVVFLVAGFGVLNTMTMSVFERTRELGVLRALGIRPGRLVLMVLFEALALALISGVMGLFFGSLLDLYVVVYGVDFGGSTGKGIEFAGIVLDPVVHGAVYPGSIAQIFVSLLVICVLSALWPAYRASRLSPVTAIRTE